MSKINPWNSIQKPIKDVSARRVDHTHPLNFFWAKDYLDRYLFFCEFEKGTLLPATFPELEGIEIFPPGNGSRLILLLKTKSDWKLFLTLCSDIVDSTFNIHNVTSSVSIIIRRLNRWRDFLRTARSTLLSEEKIKGLLGELLFLRNYLVPKFGVKQSIQFWRGPEGYSQDFEVNNGAIEVKCQSGTSSPYVKISSENQLCSQMPNLYLHVITLARAVQDDLNSLNLPVLLDNIRELILLHSSDIMEEFNDKLINVGYLDDDEYEEYNYIDVKSITYNVNEDFPRICKHDLHEAIRKVKYSISLSQCESFKGEPDWMKEDYENQ